MEELGVFFSFDAINKLTNEILKQSEQITETPNPQMAEPNATLIAALALQDILPSNTNNNLNEERENPINLN